MCGVPSGWGPRALVWLMSEAVADSAEKRLVMLAPEYLASGAMVCQPSSMMSVRAGVPQAARDCSPSSMPAAETCCPGEAGEARKGNARA